MPLVSQIFKKYAVSRFGRFRDNKFEQCEVITDIEEIPFVKRCSNPKGEALKVCLVHAFTVNWKSAGDVERTKYFSTIAGAEQFRKSEVALTWTETNYEIPRPVWKTPPVAKG